MKYLSKSNVQWNFQRLLKSLLVSLFMQQTALLFAQELTPTFVFHRHKDSVAVTNAVVLFDAGKYEESKREIEKLPKRLYADAPGMLYLLGSCKYSLNDFEGAVMSYSMALAYDPESIGTYYDRAFALMALGKYKAAASDFSAYAIHFPYNEKVVRNLTACLADDGQLNAAIAYLEKYDRKDSMLYDFLAIKHTEAENYDRAIEIWSDMLKLSPNSPAVLEGLSIAYSENSEYDQAFYFIGRLIKLQPKNGRAYYLQGVYYSEIEEEEKAEYCFQAARSYGYNVERNASE